MPKDKIIKFKDQIKEKSYKELVKMKNVLANKIILHSEFRGGKGVFGTGAKCFRFDEEKGIWLGAGDYDNALFKVSLAGVMNAVSGVFSGDISAATGKYLEPFIAGEDIAIGKSVSIFGKASQTSTYAMLTDEATAVEEQPDSVFANQLKVVNETGKKCYAFMKWNLTNMPDDEIISAVLHIRVASYNAVEVKMTRVTESWAEASLTWNNKPDRTIGHYWTGAVGGTNTWKEMDITGLYREWVSGTQYGLCFEPTVGGVGDQTTFASGVTYYAYLVVTYRKKESGKVYKAIASDPKCAAGFIGFASEGKSSGESIKIAISGIEVNQSGLTVGAKYYLSDTAGEIYLLPGALYSDSLGVLVGKAISATKLLIYNDFVNAESIGNKHYYRITDDIYISDDDAETTIIDTYHKVKEFTLPGNFESQNVRVYFELKGDGTYSSLGRVYKNGSPFGTERSTSSGTYQEYPEDLLFQAGDKIQLYVKAGTEGQNAWHRYFRILGSSDLVTDEYDIQITA